MNSGTYSEAKAAGFNDDQAGFFARMCCDTKNEIWNELENRQAKKKAQRLKESLAYAEKIFAYFVCMAIGIALGNMIFG